MHQKEEKKKRNFHAKDSPNFKILHEKFIKTVWIYEYDEKCFANGESELINWKGRKRNKE